jgi:hypothetical protein
MPNRAEILKQKFTQSLGLPFRKLLPSSEIEQVLVEEKVQYRNCVFTPAVTLWAFLSQVLEPDKSLRNAVSRVITWLTAAGATLPSTDTGAYSKVSPLRVSLQGCRQHLNNFVAELASATIQECQRLYRQLWQVYTDKLVPLRPHRVEPRVKKRRPKNYPRMRQPRSVLKANLTA